MGCQEAAWGCAPRGHAQGLPEEGFAPTIALHLPGSVLSYEMQNKGEAGEAPLAAFK